MSKRRRRKKDKERTHPFVSLDGKERAPLSALLPTTVHEKSKTLFLSAAYRHRQAGRFAVLSRCNKTRYWQRYIKGPNGKPRLAPLQSYPSFPASTMSYRGHMVNVRDIC